MSLALVLFFVIAFATGLSAVALVVTRNIVRSAVWLLFKRSASSSARARLSV